MIRLVIFVGLNEGKKYTVFNNKIKQVTSLFKETKADIDSLELVDQYTKKAIQYINMLSISEDKKNEFILFSKELMERDL